MTTKITRADNNSSGYGKHIRIEHGYGYLSLYAHLSQYNVKKGQKVKRGDLIGFVGSTGRSEAPHLHYEVLKNNIRINPQKLKLPSGRKLKGDELQRFIETKNLIYRKLDGLGVY